MYVYRIMSSKELVNRLNGINTNDAKIKGINTFGYKNGTDYIHFYKFAAHAFKNIEKFGCVVAKIKLDDEIIPSLEYGFYSGIKTYYDDTLFHQEFPMPEIIINRELFSNEMIVGFSNKHIGNFTINEDGSYLPEFWVTKKNPFNKEENRLWTIGDIYYEYIKILLPLFDHDMYAVVRYLKTIDLDNELLLLTEEIKENKIIMKHLRIKKRVEQYKKEISAKSKTKTLSYIRR